ncbi:MAG: putative glycoside hydrolase [Eubacteriales bacterium]|nr:putative glycoside hydrolase [Eubacteriales bacterium]
MARQSEFYKGRKKKRSYAIVPTAIAVGVITLLVVLFYGMQKYAVISKDGVQVELPILTRAQTAVDASGNEIRVFENVDADIVYDEPDYSYVKATAGRKTPEMRAIFVPSENINRDKLMEYAKRLKSGNALVLEMKPPSGVLLWNSHSEVAMNYGLSTPNELTDQLPDILAELKEDNIYLAAQISCCLDELFVTRSTNVALRRADNGANYSDGYGTWLDPYNQILRNYIAELARELFDMGFDEVVLADVAHPVVEEGTELLYTRELSTPPGAYSAVCGFAINVAKALRDRTGLLSIYCNNSAGLVKPDTNGQDARVFMKLYDRVYINTDKFSYTYNLQDIKGSVPFGKAENRLVPVVISNLPDNPSWVLVDAPQG